MKNALIVTLFWLSVLPAMGTTIETTGVRENHPEDFYQARVEISVKLPDYDKYYRIRNNYQDDIYMERSFCISMIPDLKRP